jgi:hypothetical protein
MANDLSLLCIQYCSILRKVTGNNTIAGSQKKISVECYINVALFLIIKDKEMHYFSTLFGKELYMFWTDLLSIIRRIILYLEQ